MFLTSCAYVRKPFIFVTSIVLLSLLAACAVQRDPQVQPDPPQDDIVYTDPDTGMAPAVPGPWRHDPRGPQRPPSRDELIQLDDMPTGAGLSGGLPTPNIRVNQDSSGEPQNETSIIADPSNPNIIVGMWNDYFNVNPGQNTVIGYGWTGDGGQTWQSDRVNFGTLPSDQSTGDPAVTADSTGIFYMAILAYSGSASGILVSRSLDSGVTWQEPVRLDNGGDKEFITVDLANDNVYVVWENASIDGQSIYFSKSTDQGMTYTARQKISGPGSTGNGAYPAVGPNGEIYVLWSNFNNALYFDRSLDQGNTWLPNDVVVTNTIDQPRSPLDGGFRNPLIPALAADATSGPLSGRIYAVWGDERFSGDPDIALSWSDDRGDTWSAPARVNDDVIGNDADQFFAWVTVDANGHVHVTYLDRRDDPDGLLLAMYLSTSTDGGVTFGPAIRISDGSSAITPVPRSPRTTASSRCGPTGETSTRTPSSRACPSTTTTRTACSTTATATASTPATAAPAGSPSAATTTAPARRTWPSSTATATWSATCATTARSTPTPTSSTSTATTSAMPATSAREWSAATDPTRTSTGSPPAWTTARAWPTPARRTATATASATCATSARRARSTTRTATGSAATWTTACRSSTHSSSTPMPTGSATCATSARRPSTPARPMPMATARAMPATASRPTGTTALPARRPA
jgi:hypothetical protein